LSRRYSLLLANLHKHIAMPYTECPVHAIADKPFLYRPSNLDVHDIGPQEKIMKKMRARG
jgi:hypothetical protein